MILFRNKFFGVKSSDLTSFLKLFPFKNYSYLVLKKKTTKHSVGIILLLKMLVRSLLFSQPRITILLKGRIKIVNLMGYTRICQYFVIWTIFDRLDDNNNRLTSNWFFLIFCSAMKILQFLEIRKTTKLGCQK